MPRRRCRSRISARIPARRFSSTRRQRLVEQQHARPRDQRARQRDALFLPAGQRGGAPLAESVELNRAQRVGDCYGSMVAMFTAGHPHREAEADALGDRHVRKQQRLLKHHRDAAPLGGDAQ